MNNQSRRRPSNKNNVMAFIESIFFKRKRQNSIHKSQLKTLSSLEQEAENASKIEAEKHRRRKKRFFFSRKKKSQPTNHLITEKELEEKRKKNIFYRINMIIFSPFKKGRKRTKRKSFNELTKAPLASVQTAPKRKKRRKPRVPIRTRITTFFRTLRRKITQLFISDTQKDMLKKGVFPLFSYYKYTLNSTILFIAAYLIAYMTYQLTTIITASTFNIDSVLYYFEIQFPIGIHNYLWTAYNIIVITLSGPLISLLIGLYLYWKCSEKTITNPFKQMFLLWLTFHFLCQFFVAWTAGIITGQGFGYVADWMFLSIFYRFLIALLLIAILVFMGYHITDKFLQTANSKMRANLTNRNKFITAQGLVPAIIGSLILFFIKLPNRLPQHENITVYDTILMVSVISFIIPIFFNRNEKAIVVGKSNTKKIRAQKYLTYITTIAALIFFRTILSDGIHFLIELSINITRYR